MPISPLLETVLSRLKTFREEAGVSTAELEEQLILGPGWIERFESGATVPTLDVLIVMLRLLGRSINELFEGVTASGHAGTIERSLFAERAEDSVILHFDYADFSASYRLQSASLDEFEDVLRVLRNGLSATGQKSNAVVATFLRAVQLWPNANPSDLWWFLIYRAYIDPFNHPSSEARRSFEQSWKRTGGWALERILVAHYGPFLKEHGISMAIPQAEEKKELLDQLEISSRLEADKVDVVLSGASGQTRQCFGVVHVKASFAERRTDDVELSKGLIEAGYCSPFWTMDCKSSPSTAPINRGELGELLGQVGDERSAKRKDFEVDGFFSACFSYNARTKPTPSHQDAVAARIYICDFRDPDDDFSRFIRSEWERLRS